MEHQHQDILPHSDRRDLGDINNPAAFKVSLLINEHDGNYHVNTSHVSDDCPLLVSPIMITIIRHHHSSWASPSGVILLGGHVSPNTSERIQDDGTSTDSFSLEYSLE